MDNWDIAQKEELIFWSLQNYNIPECYNKKYKFFESFIKEQNPTQIIDVGCGAIAYSVLFNFKCPAILFDSLLSEYIKLSSDKTNLHNLNENYVKIKGCVENIPFKDNKFDLTFFLNVLDHVQSPVKSFDEVVRITKKDGYILFFCDLRNEIDSCHPHKISKDLIKSFEQQHSLQIIKQNIQNYCNMPNYYAIYKK